MRLNHKTTGWVYAWLLLLPASVLMVTFTHYPIVGGIFASFFSTPKQGRASRFVGLDNYSYMVEDPVFWQVLGNNFIYALGTIMYRALSGALPFGDATGIASRRR